MKRYNINPVKREFSWGEMKVLTLGEKGRGRYESIIPYHANEDSKNLEIGLTKSGNPKIVSSANENGWLAVVSGSGTYTRGTYGSVYCLEDGSNSVSIVSSGSGAYGQAGRIGGWNEFLVVINSPLFLYIRPAGGSHKRPPYWLFFNEKVRKIENEELSMFCEHSNLEVPKGDLIDLITKKKE